MQLCQLLYHYLKITLIHKYLNMFWPLNYIQSLKYIKYNYLHLYKLHNFIYKIHMQLYWLLYHYIKIIQTSKNLNKILMQNHMHNPKYIQYKLQYQNMYHNAPNNYHMLMYLLMYHYSKIAQINKSFNKMFKLNYIHIPKNI